MRLSIPPHQPIGNDWPNKIVTTATRRATPGVDNSLSFLRIQFFDLTACIMLSTSPSIDLLLTAWKSSATESPITALGGERPQPMDREIGLLLNPVEVQGAQAPVVDHEAAIDDDIAHIAPAGVADKLRHQVEARTQMRPSAVEH